MLVIVTEAMESAIKRDLDALRDQLPEDERPIFEAERHIHRQEIINFFGTHGYYPVVEGINRQTDGGR